MVVSSAKKGNQTNTRNRNSCRQLFKILKMFPFQSQYIYSLLRFVVNNLDQYQFISEVHNRNTRQGSNLYQPSAHLSLYQKGTYYMGIKLFNSLPPQLKHLYNDHKCFKFALKDFLYCHSFYTLEEYFDHGIIKILIFYSAVCYINIDYFRIYCSI
jgi:hypothetical protein